MDGVAADLITVLARVAVGLVRDPVQRKFRVHALFGQAELHPALLCIRLQGCRKLLRRVDAALRDKEKVLLMLRLRQRAVILHPAGEKCLRLCGIFHPRQAGVHIQRRRRRVLPGQFCAKTRRPFQLLCALLQCGLLLPQNIPQRCIARQHGPDDRKRHIQHSQHPDEPEGADILFCVVAVIVAGQSGRVQKSLFFIESDIGGGHPALFRSLFDVHLLHLRTHITP